MYVQVAQAVRRRIGAGEWRPGERIVPEVRLAREYDVSRVTVRQALAELVKDDLLERKRGSGTFVRPQPRPLLWDLNLTVGAYASQLRARGFSNRAEVIEAGLQEAPIAEVRDALRLAPGAVVAYLLRVVLINDEPAAIYRSWLQAATAPGIERSAGLSGSLSDVLAQEHGLVPTHSDYRLEVARSSPEEAALLRTNGDAPLLVVTSTSYLPDGRPLEHAQMQWLGDRVRLHVGAPQARS